ncbi:hypothetical protein [Microbispora catharanthi]|uniref:Peptidase inhibitor family I36 n=1 Tax=Microbispora catharanthi TaxID=1712871 RepID=A0A5N6BKT5_9ACTN|nr:hypothetical protein [Microbispora catharanthi]KAB8180778.1 hypothetical protein FH610_031380 [Microbispora catharanthi]
MKQTLTRRMARILAAVALGSATAVLLTAPAKAGPAGANGYCFEGELCLYRLLAGGERVDYYIPDSDFTDDNYWYLSGSTWAQSYLTVNNTASRAENLDLSCSAVLWQLVGGSGTSVVMYPGMRISDMANVDFDNKASAVTWRCP